MTIISPHSTLFQAIDKQPDNSHFTMYCIRRKLNVNSKPKVQSEFIHHDMLETAQLKYE